MIEKSIRLNSIDDIKKFVQITSTKEFTITLELGNDIADAKVIDEIFYLDLTKTLTLRADCKTTAELYQLEAFCRH